MIYILIKDSQLQTIGSVADEKRIACQMTMDLIECIKDERGGGC